MRLLVHPPHAPLSPHSPNALCSLFDKFVEEVVLPSMCGLTQGGDPIRGCVVEAGRTVVYQAKPSLRVQPPGGKGIRFHRDADYMHQVHGLDQPKRARDLGTSTSPSTSTPPNPVSLF